MTPIWSARLRAGALRSWADADIRRRRLEAIRAAKKSLIRPTMMAAACRKGLHEMTYENTIVDARGYRRCRACLYIAYKRYTASGKRNIARKKRAASKG